MESCLILAAENSAASNSGDKAVAHTEIWVCTQYVCLLKPKRRSTRRWPVAPIPLKRRITSATYNGAGNEFPGPAACSSTNHSAAPLHASSFRPSPPSPQLHRHLSRGTCCESSQIVGLAFVTLVSRQLAWRRIQVIPVIGELIVSDSCLYVASQYNSHSLSSYCLMC